MILLMIASLLTPLSRATTFTYPQNFQWCVATAGHQIEGDNVHSDWWAWEQLPGKIRNSDKSGKASYHMDRLDEDVTWIKKLGANTYRFSIEWSRIEPKPGVYDSESIRYYQRELALLKKNNITPFVTIHHFVQPQWFTASGGWRRADAPEVFLKYVQKIESEFGEHINHWVTFNEPSVLLLGGYGLGLMPPGENHWDLWQPTENILKAHALAYAYLHQQAQKRQQKILVGLAFHIRPLISGHWFLNGLIHQADELTNWSLPEAIKTGFMKTVRFKNFFGLKIPWISTKKIEGLANTQDFLGVNYYTREYLKLTWGTPWIERLPAPGLVGTELLNWGIDPEGFYVALKIAHDKFDSLPIYITENGLTDPSDKYRNDYIVSHLAYLNKAMQELPIEVLGYCHWSLMDNFEWIEGFTPRFGLIEVDYTTGERKARPSAQVIEEIFKSRELTYKINE